MPRFKTFPAEEEIPILKEVEDRVEFISDLMEDMVWKRGKSAKILAKRWGLSKSTVESNAAEASRRVTADAETVRRIITAQGEKLMMDAFRTGKAKDWGIVSKLMAEVSGANAPVKQELTVNDPKGRGKALFGSVFGATKPESEPDDESATEGELEATTSEPVETDNE